MDHGRFWLKSASPGLRLLAVLALMITTMSSAAVAQISRQAEMENMSIMPRGPDGPVLGVGFTVTTEDGAPLGSCTVPLDFPPGYIPNCQVQVPLNTIVVIWFDPASSSTTLVPVENPVYFDTTPPEQAAQMWGSGFTFQAAGGSGSATSNGESSSQSRGGAAIDALSLLPKIGDVPGGLVETGRQTRTLPEVAANYTDAAETTQLFTQWGWEQNAIASFAIPSNQGDQSGVINGVYVSIHRFSNPDGSRAALDFSLTEQAAGTPLQEVGTPQFGEYTRALFGPMDYGNETTLLTQQDGLLIRVSASMLDGDPTVEAESIMQGIVQRATSTTETGSTASVGASEQTWSASVQVNLCDAPPNSGQAMNCQAGAGVVVTISLASGAFLGSCTTGDPIATPWDTYISLCGVEGMPFNADLIATQDPSTIPAGYEPFENSLSLHVDDLIPGGGDQATFTFFNVRTNTGSTNPSGNTSTASGSATLLMTFRGCPEGFNPEWDDFFASCTIPLDAPDNAFLDYHGEGQGGHFIAFMDRQYNGAYIYQAHPITMNVDLYGLAPVVRDTYQVIGADSVNGSTYTVNLVNGETREVYVFYYFYS